MNRQPDSPRLTAINGGIGAGKSVVSAILTAMDFPVYDCDTRAIALVEGNEGLKQLICTHVCPDAVTPDGTYNRQAVSRTVFTDKTLLNKLNSLIHTAVFADLAKWRDAHANAGKRLFVESAILYSSGLWQHVNDAWEITAPLEIRVRRVMKRSGLTARQVLARIDAQKTENTRPENFPVTEITNDGTTPLLPQILSALSH